MSSSGSNESQDQEVVAARGKVTTKSKLTIPSLIQYRLWLTNPDDYVQYFVDRIKKKIYIQKKDERLFADDDGEFVTEVKVMQKRWLYLPASIRDMLWLETNDYVEYIVDPTGKLRFYLRRRE